jgi:hypothetical protein
MLRPKRRDKAGGGAKTDDYIAEIQDLILEELLTNSAGILPQWTNDMGTALNRLKGRVMAYGYHGIKDHGIADRTIYSEACWYSKYAGVSQGTAYVAWIQEPTGKEKALIEIGLFNEGSTEKRSERITREVVQRASGPKLKYHLEFEVDEIHTSILRVCKAFHARGISILYGKNEFIFKTDLGALNLKNALNLNQAYCGLSNDERIRHAIDNVFDESKTCSLSDDLSQFLRGIGLRNASIIRRVVLAGSEEYFKARNEQHMDLGYFGLGLPLFQLEHPNTLRVHTLMLGQICPRLRKLTLHRECFFGKSLSYPKISEDTINKVVQSLPFLEELRFGYFDEWFRLEDSVDIPWTGEILRWESVVKERFLERRRNEKESQDRIMDLEE